MLSLYEFKTVQGWSKTFWDFLYTIVATYPPNPSPEVRKDTLNLLISLRSVLPCPKCRRHFKENMTISPLTEETVETRDNLFNWVSGLHNLINKNNGKRMLCSEEAKQSIHDRLSYNDYLYGWGNPLIINTEYVIVSVTIITIILLIFYLGKGF